MPIRAKYNVCCVRLKARTAADAYREADAHIFVHIKRIAALHQLVHESDTQYLDELCDNLAARISKRVSTRTMLRALCKLGLTRKKARPPWAQLACARRLGAARSPALTLHRATQLHSIAAERREHERLDCAIRCKEEFKTEQYIWVDESSVVGAHCHRVASRRVTCHSRR